VMIALFINHSYYTWFKKELAEVKSWVENYLY
jgi:hypothetical protein